MSEANPVPGTVDVATRKRIRRNVLLLSLLAVAFYVGFFVLNILRVS